MPNLLVLSPVEMCGWLRASMSGLTRSATRARVCALARERVDPLELALRLRVDGLDAEIDRLRQLRGGLADAGEDDLRRNESGAQRDVDLAAGVRVGAAAQAAQQPRDRQRRVRLERVVHRVRIRRRTPRRSRGSAPRSSRRCRRRAACPRPRRSPASGTPSHASVPRGAGSRSRNMYQVEWRS